MGIFHSDKDMKLTTHVEEKERKRQELKRGKRMIKTLNYCQSGRKNERDAGTRISYNATNIKSKSSPDRTDKIHYQEN